MENRRNKIIDLLNFLRESTLKTVIFGLSGSVASIKAKEIIQELIHLNLNVIIVPTESASRFICECSEDFRI